MPRTERCRPRTSCPRDLRGSVQVSCLPSIVESDQRDAGPEGCAHRHGGGPSVPRAGWRSLQHHSASSFGPIDEDRPAPMDVPRRQPIRQNGRTQPHRFLGALSKACVSRHPLVGARWSMEQDASPSPVAGLESLPALVAARRAPACDRSCGAGYVPSSGARGSAIPVAAGRARSTGERLGARSLEPGGRPTSWLLPNKVKALALCS